jgi:hypothetical protein
MASDAALTQAREFIEQANVATDDPRRTRIDLLQIANYIARVARGNPELRNLVSEVSEFLAGQAVSGKDLDLAAEKGWPVIEAAPGPISYFYAGLRLAAHAALRRSSLIDNFAERVRGVEGLTASVQRTIESMEPDWASAVVVVAADMGAESEEFRRRLSAAAKDVQQLVTSDELPTWDDFAEGPAGSAWPPLALGVYPVLGGRFRDDPDKDWEYWDEAAGGGLGTAAVCTVAFGSEGDIGKVFLCVLGVLAILAICVLVA